MASLVAGSVLAEAVFEFATPQACRMFLSQEALGPSLARAQAWRCLSRGKPAALPPGCERHPDARRVEAEFQVRSKAWCRGRYWGCGPLLPQVHYLRLALFSRANPIREQPLSVTRPCA